MGSNGDLIRIQQYLQGTLSPGEMHDFEKRVLNDPFLADALEGYAQSGAHAGSQLSLLQRRLEERIARAAEDKNRFYFSWQRLSVAAAAGILFLSAGILFWMKSQPFKTQPKSTPGKVDVRLDPTLRHLNKQQIPASDSTKHAQPTAPPPPSKSKGAPGKAGATADSFKPGMDKALLLENFVIADKIQPEPKRKQEFEDFVGSLPAAAKDQSVDLSAAQVVSSSQDYKGYLEKALSAAAESLGYKGKVYIAFNVSEKGELLTVAAASKPLHVLDPAIVKALANGPAWPSSAKAHDEYFEITFR